MIITKIQPHHTSKQAYIYLRQSSMGQVQFNQESTQRQYALQNKAQQMGWSQPSIRILDGDLGISGMHSSNREDFKTLVADVSMGKVGAVFALEASRLSRSCADWHRLLELCAMTDTLIVDEDGCYNLTDFNDQLVLNVRGTMSQAEIHYIRARLQGGKMNKAKKGELKFLLPIGLCYDEKNRIRLDPDEQIQNAVRLLFNLFKEKGSAYGVADHFVKEQIQFPKIIRRGAWKGNLTWGNLAKNKAVSILRNPLYSGVYAYGRVKCQKKLSETGQLQSSTVSLPMGSWPVMIKDHHEAYISWDDYLNNQVILDQNRAKQKENTLPLSAREGLALLQGLLVCGICGHRFTTRYQGHGGIYPTYQCHQRVKDAATGNFCVSISAKDLDQAISDRILMVIKPSQIEIAVKAFEELEQRSQSLEKQWLMKIERARYESQLAQRRYQEVDPSNRLVAGTLEKDWNDTLICLQEALLQYEEYKEKNTLMVAKGKKESLLSLAKDFPRLWNAPTTSSKDRKRIVRLFIKDITVEKSQVERKIILHIRWQGGALEDIEVPIPLRPYEKWKHSDEIINRVRELAITMSDVQIAEKFSQEGLKTNKGYFFTRRTICNIRFNYKIPAFLPSAGEFSISQVAEKFNVSYNFVHRRIQKNAISARRVGQKFWILLDSEKEAELKNLVENSSRRAAVRIRSKKEL